jgi:hypothetical protein
MRYRLTCFIPYNDPSENKSSENELLKERHNRNNYLWQRMPYVRVFLFLALCRKHHSRQKVIL